MQLTRRELMAGALASSGAFAAPAYQPKLAAQMYIWTQVLRKQDRSIEEGVTDVVAGTRAAGYDSAEFMSGFFTPKIRDKTIGLLTEHGLNVPICYHGGLMHTEAGCAKMMKETLELVEVLQPLGTRMINTNPVPKPKKALKTDAELAIQAKGLMELGEALDKRGVQLIVHHHDPEMYEEAREWRHILKRTTLPLCIDFMWVKRGGQDPLSILKEAGDRVATLHIRNMQNGVCTEAAGDGEIDYPGIVDYLKGRGFDGWAIVELFHEPTTKVTRPLEANLRMSREWVEGAFEL
jgi:inosose dehydratase